VTPTLPPLTVGRFFFTWHFDGWVAAGVLIMLAGYLLALRAAARRGTTWPRARTAWFVALGLGTIVVATMSSLAVYSQVLLWPMALQISLLLTIVPVGLGLGHPLGLIGAALSPRGAARWDRALTGPVVRVLTFPAVAPLLVVATQFVVFYSGYIGASQQHAWVLHLLQFQLVVTGCLFALPMLGAEVLPAWCTQPVRMVFAGVDGLLDAVPAIAVMTSATLVAHGYYATVNPSWGPTASWDQTIAGGLMLTVAEVVAIPFVAILFREWAREDARHARVIDRALDLEDLRRPVTLDEDETPHTVRPWWEVDPGPLADRAARYGWAEDSRPDD
jgi:cytochrome c oxidase assembly factor CtaG